MSEERLLILGLGNPLMGDDGAGIQIVNELRESDLPEYVDVIDGGTAGVGLIDLMSGYSRVIVVDAVRGEDVFKYDENPGNYYCWHTCRQHCTGDWTIRGMQEILTRGNQFNHAGSCINI